MILRYPGIAAVKRSNEILGYLRHLHATQKELSDIIQTSICFQFIINNNNSKYIQKRASMVTTKWETNFHEKNQWNPGPVSPFKERLRI